MADPFSTADVFDVQVNFLPPVAVGRRAFGNPTAVAEFADNVSFDGRIKEYTGTQTQKLALLLADGFATTSDTYRQVLSMNLQDGPARTMYVGRKDAGDADWGVGMAAVKAEADLEGLAFYAFTAATRDAAEIEAIADWQEGTPDAPVFAFYLAQTADANILADNPGNLARNILAKQYERIALTWHDPATSSKYGPAVLQSTVGPFNIPNGSDIDLRVDGGVTQPFSFASAAATLLGSNTETFAVLDGETLVFAANGGSNQTITYSAVAATMVGLNTETFVFVDGLTLNVRVDGAAPQPVIFNGTPGSVTTAAAPYAFNALDNIDFSIDGGGTQNIVFEVGDTTSALVAVKLGALTGVTITDTGTTVIIASNRSGTSSDVEIVAGVANALTELGLVVANNVGTGFAPFLDVATAAQVFAEIDTDTTGLAASDDGGAVRLTSDTFGTSSRIQVSGGTAVVVLGFDTNESVGSGDFLDASVATAAEMIVPISTSAQGVLASIDTGAVRLTSTLVGSASVIDVAGSVIATTLGLSLVAVAGSGDFSNAAQATPAEVANVIGLTLTDAVASSANSQVKITSNTSGTASTVQAVSGSLLDTLAFVDSVTSVKNLATGVGVLEDFADAAWMGRCITFNLDGASSSGEGAALWNSQELKGPSPSGAGTVTLAGDRNLAQYRDLLHNTLKVNTYELRDRNTTHFGTLLNDQLGFGGYIDIRTTIDWTQARLSEDFLAIDKAAAKAKTKHDYAASGIDVYDQALRGRLQLADRNGHSFYDSSPLDLNNPQDTGIFTPTVAQQTQGDINNRLIDGFRASQQARGGIQRGRVIINYIGPTAAT